MSSFEGPRTTVEIAGRRTPDAPTQYTPITYGLLVLPPSDDHSFALFTVVSEAALCDDKADARSSAVGAGHIVYRRYKSFSKLVLALKDELPSGTVLPPMPPRGAFGGRRHSNEFLEERTRRLLEIVSAALAADPLVQAPALRAFLGLDGSCFDDALDAAKQPGIGTPTQLRSVRQEKPEESKGNVEGVSSSGGVTEKEGQTEHSVSGSRGGRRSIRSCPTGSFSSRAGTFDCDPEASMPARRARSRDSANDSDVERASSFRGLACMTNSPVVRVASQIAVTAVQIVA